MSGLQLGKELPDGRETSKVFIRGKKYSTWGQTHGRTRRETLSCTRGSLNHCYGAFLLVSFAVILIWLVLSLHLVYLRSLPYVHVHLLAKMDFLVETYGHLTSLTMKWRPLPFDLQGAFCAYVVGEVSDFKNEEYVVFYLLPGQGPEFSIILFTWSFCPQKISYLASSPSMSCFTLTMPSTQDTVNAIVKQAPFAWTPRLGIDAPRYFTATESPVQKFIWSVIFPFIHLTDANKNIILINKRMGRCGWEIKGTHPNRVDIFRWLSRKGVQVAPFVLTCFCSESLSLLTEDTDDP